MDNFLGKYALPEFTPLELERPIPIKEIEKIIKELLHKKEQSLDVFPGRFYQTLREDTFSELSILFQSLENNRKHPNSIHNAKPDKDITRKKIRCQYHSGM